MSFWREKQSRHFCYSLILLALLWHGWSWLFGIVQTQTAQEMLLSRDSAVAGALLKQGVPPEVIASAMAAPQDDGQGKNLLRQLGYTEQTAFYDLPALSGFTAATFQWVFLGAFVFMILLLALGWFFLIRRERLYRQALKVIGGFGEGDFTAHLPRSAEGTLSQLFAAVENLASALQAKGETEHKTRDFLKNTISDISHQLKTPLAALTVYNEIILAEPDNPALITEFSRKTTAALQRMEQLIQALLKITRLDAGSITFAKTPQRIAEMAAQAIGELRVRAAREGKSIIISGELEEELNCDGQWTREAVGNIVKNALDHTTSGGHIRISWERSPAMVRISIADDGKGIAPEDIHHIFKRFYRSRHSQNIPGVGLGLALAQAIIEGQGGMLSVQSAPNAGATFTLSFLTEL
ncbi:sensor histidine kinase [Desulfitobacterium chlororespirans]|uniref:histidine kinase n=1 Tax=Desulfitobacterium chlororespirans DSM 11544 TaxID=1121395 RepID=A0A1M7SDC8_9FIRM|nr:HAMP domain-containing sensor histidine kinase [Desulfitobacterium chlororespirans]SHN56517.1 Signal transduction histidine kinase [Desulfitobacterium chlororespirans DSM 11544]